MVKVLYNKNFQILMLKTCRIAFSALTKQKKYEVFHLKKEVEAFPSASNSVLTSTAAYLVKQFPTLPHPRLIKQRLPHQRKDAQYPSLYLSLHPLFDEWAQIFGEAIIKRNACRDGHTLYIKIDIDEEYASLLKDSGWQCNLSNENLSVNKIFGINGQTNGKKIGLLSCQLTQLNKVSFKPNINVLSTLLGEIFNNQQYDYYNILRGQIPSVEQLLSYDTIIIPGSGLSTLSSVPQVESLSKNILEAYRKSDKLKIFGICFGHQLIAKTMGATVIKKKRISGIEHIRFSKQLISKFKFLDPLSKVEDLNLHLSEHHEDFVTTIPEGFLQLAVSESCQNQSFVSEDGRIFSTQFHPQYTHHYLKAYEVRQRIYRTNQIEQKFQYAYSEEIIEKHLKNSDFLRQSIAKFI